MKIAQILIVVLIILAGYIALSDGRYYEVKRFFIPLESVTVSVGKNQLFVDVVSTDDDRAKGLSGREKLGEKEGLLFVFEDDAPHGIWMKDMRFPIDIIWIGSDSMVIEVVENAMPATYPEVFRPDGDAAYVLEVNAGVAERIGIQKGTEIRIPREVQQLR